ncbi:MAG: ATP-grasp domain-containing protein [Candidatus Gribaldobacteria bacterium]|nr:ATP-grasp domain-containing protein [Candidatus Gribaldobacteria bacterium]
MNPNKEKIAVFGDYIEFLLISRYINDLPFELVYFFEKDFGGRPLLSKNAKHVCYSFRGGYQFADEKDFIEATIKNSDLTKKIKEEEISLVWPVFCIRNFDIILKWARNNTFRLVGLPRLMLKLENKLFFDKFLTKHNIKKPISKEITYGDRSRFFNPPFVLQTPLSDGGAGTFIIKNTNECQALKKSGEIKRKSKLLMRKWVEGIPCGITILVSKDEIILSSIRRQCFGDNNKHNFYKEFEGLQFIAFKDINLVAVKNINKVFKNIGTIFRKEGWEGFFSFDFIISSNGDIYLIECNPRISAASALLFHFPILFGGSNAISIFLSDIKAKKHNKKIIFKSLPENDFKGSVLYLVINGSSKNPVLIEKNFKDGIYESKEGKFSFLSSDTANFGLKKKKILFKNEAQEGTIYKNQSMFASILSNFPLYNSAGDLNEEGKLIKDYFKYD